MTPDIILMIAIAIAVALGVRPLSRSKLDELYKAAHEASLRAEEARKKLAEASLRADAARKRAEEARKKLAEARAKLENDLRTLVKNWQDLANKRLTVSNAEKAELEERIRTIQENLDFAKQHFGKERDRLIVSLKKNSEDLATLKSGAKNNLTEAETMGLELFEAMNDKELLRIERLLALIRSAGETTG